MGLKENLIMDWTDKIIEYQEREFLILKQFKYEGKEYLYGAEVKTIGTEKMNVVFLSKVKDDIFEHVEDDELFEKLFITVSGMLAAEMVEEDAKKYFKK